MNVEDEQTNSQQQNQTEGTTPSTTTTEETTTAQTDSLVQGEKTEEENAAEAAAATAAEFVPLTAEDVTFPDGFEVVDERRDEALAIVNNRELSPKEQLQGLIDLQAKVAKEASDAISETWTQTQKAWQDEVKADPTIGGDKLPDTLAAVNKLVTEYGDDKLVEAFAMTGAGNNVHVIRFLNSVAGKLLEGSHVQAGGPTNQEESAAERLFPSMKKG